MYKMNCKKCNKQQFHENGECLKCGIVTSQHSEPSTVFFKTVDNSFSSGSRRSASTTVSRKSAPVIIPMFFDDSNCGD